MSIRTLVPTLVLPRLALRTLSIAGTVLILTATSQAQSRCPVSGPGPGSQTPPGITQPTFSGSFTFGQVVYEFDVGPWAPGNEPIPGNQTTIADFQHGWLYAGTGGFGGQGTPTVNWIDISDPFQPVVAHTATYSKGNKPHVSTFWNYQDNGGSTVRAFISWKNGGRLLSILDFLTGDEIGEELFTDMRPMATGVQPPYEYRFESSYTTGPNVLYVAKFPNDDLRAGLGASEANVISDPMSFYGNTAHVIGNLLVVSGGRAGQGVATFDVSDPVNPILLDELIVDADPTTQQVEGLPYSSMVYGSSIYVCEDNRPNNGNIQLNGIRRYDFSDPRNIVSTPSDFLSLPGLVPRYVTLKEGKGYVAPGADKLISFDADTMVQIDEATLAGETDFTFPLGNLIYVGGPDSTSSSPQNYTALLAIEQFPDLDGPSVEYANPSDGAGDVALTSRIGFQMSDHIDVNSMDTESFIVRPVCGTAISGTYSTSHYGIINFAPDQALLPNQTYEVILPAGGVSDVVGNAIEEAYVMRFTTSVNGSVAVGAKRWELDGNASPGGSAVGIDWVTYNNRMAAEFGIGDETDHIDLGQLTELDGDFTLSMWVSLDDIQAAEHTLISNTTTGLQPGSVLDGFRLAINSSQTSNGRVRFQTGDGTTLRTVQTPGDTIQGNGWHFIAVTVDRSEGKARIFVNGCEKTPGDNGIVSGFTTAQRDVHLGQMTNGALDLEGRLDDVQIHTSVLSAADIAVLQSQGFDSEYVSISSFTTDDEVITVGSQALFTVLATDPDGLDLFYKFDFEDDPTPGTYGAAGVNTTTHTFDDVGRFTVTATVKNENDDTVSRSLVQVVVEDLAGISSPTHSTTVACNAAGDEVYVVNPDNDSLAIVDESTQSAVEVSVGEEPRFLALRPGGSEVWVSCASASRIDVVDVTSQVVTDTIWLPMNSRPAGIAFAPDGLAAYVAFEGTGGIAKLDPATYSVAATTAPDLSTGASRDVGLRGIAVSSDSTRVFATRFISESVDPTLDAGEVREYDASTLSFVSVILPHDYSPDTESSGSGTPNFLMDVSLSPSSGVMWIPCKKDNSERGTNQTKPVQLALNHENTVRSILCRIDLKSSGQQIPAVEDVADRVDVDNHGLCVAVTFSPEGSLAFGAFMLNNEVQAFDAVTGETVASVAVGSGPYGLCTDSGGTKLWVHNFLDRTVELLDIDDVVNGRSPAISSSMVISTVQSEKLAPNVLAGKQIFYDASDPRMSSEGYMSCASCHFDGGQDGRVWDFTNFGEGLRNTINLRGVRGMAQGNVHWTGNFDEIQDFTHPIFDHFGGTGFIDCPDEPFDPLGPPNAGLDDDLDDLADYVASLAKVPSSPYRDPSGALNATQSQGRAVFEAQNCASCHSGPLFTDSVISATAAVPPVFDTPTLRGLWDGAPFLHDGRFQDLDAILDSGDPNHTLAQPDRDDVIAYLLQLDGPDRLWPLDGEVNGFTTEEIHRGTAAVNGVGFLAGKVGQCAEFFPNDSIELGTIDFGERFTISMWIRLSNPFPIEPTFYTLLANSAEPWETDGFRLRLRMGGARKVQFRTGNGQAGNAASTGNEAFLVNTWFHLAVVVDRTTGTARIYIGGVDKTLDATIRDDFAIEQTTFMGLDGGGENPMTGRIDQVRVYDRLLEDGEVADLAAE